MDSTQNTQSQNTQSIATILQRKKPLIIGLAILLCLLLGVAWYFSSTKSNTKANNTLSIRFDTPTFYTSDTHIKISLPILTTKPLEKTELESLITIDSTNLPTIAKQNNIALDKLDDHEWQLLYEIPKPTSEKKLIVQADSVSRTITLNAQQNSAKVLDVKTYSKQKTLEIFLDRDIGLNNTKAQNSITIHKNRINDTEYKILTQGSKIIVTGDFTPRSIYTITYKHPIENESSKAEFSSLYPSLAFAQKELILPSSRDVKIGVISTNVRKSTLSLYKIPDSAMLEAINSSSYFNTDLGDKIWKKEIVFDVKKDEMQTALLLSDLIKNDLEKGAYYFKFDTQSNDVIYPNQESTQESTRDDECEYDCDELDSYHAYGQSPGKLLIISNIALVAEGDSDKLITYAFDVTSGEPLSNVKLSLISASKRVIDSATSDSKGYASLKTYKPSTIDGSVVMNADNEPSTEFALQPRYIIAESSGDTTYLPLRYDNRFYDAIDTTGKQDRKRKVFTYTDRGIATPGEALQINALVRDERIQNAPIKLSILNPKGSKILSNHTLQPIGYGLYSYTLQTDTSFATGGYKAIFTIGSEEFYKNFQVEYITPNKIRVDIDAPKVLDTAKPNLDFHITSSYLTGAKANGLKYKVNIQATPLRFTSKTYPSFNFEQSTQEQYKYDKTFDGTLDENAYAHFSLPLDDLDSHIKLQRIAITTQVFESTGHPVRNSTLTQYLGAKITLGVGEIPRYINLAEPLELPLILLNPLTDKPVKNKTIRYKIYRNNRYWWFDYNNDDIFQAKIKSDVDTTLIKEGTLQSQSKPFMLKEDLSKLVEDYDSVFIELDDGENPARIVWLVADMYGDAAIKANPMQLPLELDKSTYEVGQKAVLSFNSKGFTHALISISQGDSILQHELIPIKEPKTHYEIPLTKQFAPNAYASVTLIAKDSHTQENSPESISKKASKATTMLKRSFGLINIPVQDNALALEPQLEAPKDVRPGSKLTLRIANPKKRKMAYTLAITDEGILNIINFRTPNPLTGLYAKIKYGITHYDNFDAFMYKLFGLVHQSVLIGGDEENLGSSSDFSKKRKENLVYFTSGVTDDSGNATIEYTLPNYVGSARVMLIASDESSVGSTESTITIADPANLFSNIPEEIKHGDTIIAPVEVLAQDGFHLQEVDITLQGDVESTKLSSTTDGRRFMQYLSIKPKSIGTAHITITMQAKMQEKDANSTNPAKSSQAQDAQNKAKSPLRTQSITQSNSYNLNITAPIAPQTKQELFTLQANESKKLQSTTEFVKGSLKQSVTISPRLLYSYQDKVEYLLHYLYGCIEQSVSATMPLLLGLQGTQDYSEEERKNKVQASLNRILKFQRANGGFGYWIDSASVNEFGSDYAALFLLLAKDHGYNIPESTLKSWGRFANTRVQDSSVEPFAKANTLFLLALAGTPNIAMMNDLYTNHFSTLALREKLALAAAYKLSGLDTISKEIRAKLPRNLLDAQHYRKEDKSTRHTHYYYYGSEITNQAMSAYFLSIIDKKHDLELAQSLATTLQNSQWLGTQDIATSLLALNALDGDDTQKVRFSLDGIEHTITKPTSFAISPESTHTLQAKDKLYIALTSTGILAQDPITIPSKEQNLRLQRTFFTIDKNGNQTPINASELNIGDEFYIELTLSNVGNRPIRNLALTQIIPTGWEIQNTRLVRENDDGTESAIGDREFMKRNASASYMDILPDRVMFFFDDWLDNSDEVRSYNTHKVYIKCIATLAGTYTLGGAFAEAMYDSNFSALTNAQAISIR